jgi:hypothetical protein
MKKISYDITITALAVLLATLGYLLASPSVEVLALVTGAIGLGLLLGRAVSG